MKTPVLASAKQCTGCGACAASCSKGAISMLRENDGHIYPSIITDVCVGCLNCEKVCPIQSSFVYGDNSIHSKPLKAWNKIDEQRMISSSGGIFSALAHFFIDNGGFVSGAVIDGLSIKHIVSCDEQDIRKMQGSKYLQSETANAFTKIIELLPRHQVLFSGTGCQVAGLICLVRKKNPNLLNNLLCVDIVCDGVPSYRLLEKTIETLHSNRVCLVSFRNKSKGWNHTPKELTLEVDGEICNLGESNLLIGGFNKALTSRYSCYDCKYAFTDRQSDITIADFWGVEEETEANLYKGISLVVVHSSKGEKIINQAQILGIPVDWSTASRKNFRLYQGKKYGFANTVLRKKLSFLFNHLSYKDLMRLYAITPKSRFDIIGKMVSIWYGRKTDRMKEKINKNTLY